MKNNDLCQQSIGGIFYILVAYSGEGGFLDFLCIVLIQGEGSIYKESLIRMESCILIWLGFTVFFVCEFVVLCNYDWLKNA